MSYKGNTNVNTILTSVNPYTDVSADTAILENPLNFTESEREEPILTLHLQCSFSTSGLLYLVKERNGTTVNIKLNNGNELSEGNLYSFAIVIKNDENINFSYSKDTTIEKFEITDHYGIINIPQSAGIGEGSDSPPPAVVNSPTQLIILMWDSSSSVSGNQNLINTLNYFVKKTIANLKKNTVKTYLAIGNFDNPPVARIGKLNDEEYIDVQDLDEDINLKSLSYSNFGNLYNTVNYYLNNSPLNPICKPKVIIISDFETDHTGGQNIVQMNQDDKIGLQLVTLKNSPCNNASPTPFGCPCSTQFPKGPKRISILSTTDVDRISFDKMLWCNKRPECTLYTGVDVLRINSYSAFGPLGSPCYYIMVPIANTWEFNFVINDGNVTGVYIGDIISYSGPSFDPNAAWNHMDNVTIKGTKVNDFLVVWTDYTNTYTFYRYNGTTSIVDISSILNKNGNNKIRFWYWNFCNADSRIPQTVTRECGGFIPYLFVVYDNKVTFESPKIGMETQGRNIHCNQTIPWS